MRKNHRIELRVSKEEKAELELLAQRSGMKLSSYLLHEALYRKRQLAGETPHMEVLEISL